MVVERSFVYAEERGDIGKGDGARAFFERTGEKGLYYFIAVDPFFRHAVIISKSAAFVMCFVEAVSRATHGTVLSVGAVPVYAAIYCMLLLREYSICVIMTI